MLVNWIFIDSDDDLSHIQAVILLMTAHCRLKTSKHFFSEIWIECSTSFFNNNPHTKHDFQMQIFASISVDFPMNQFVLHAKVCKSILRSWLGAIRQPVPMLTKLCVAMGYHWEVIGCMAPSYVTWWHKWALLSLWLVTWQHQAITWAIVDKGPCLHMALLVWWVNMYIYVIFLCS